MYHQLEVTDIQFKDNIFNVLLYDEDEILRWFCKEEEEEGRMIISNQIMKSSHPTAAHQTVKIDSIQYKSRSFFQVHPPVHSSEK
uniref:Uncharacterized protein n=1 Tax=Salix viminalis TaxID=40686 RepID=A0A6N2NAP2_SALVM